jgi:putative flippase GtrA
MKSSLGKQIARFIVVGVINTGVDLVILNILIAVTHRGENGIYFSVFKTIAFLFALTNSYLMNKYWTFVGDAAKGKNLIEASQFILVSLVGLVINVLVASAVVNYIPPFWLIREIWTGAANHPQLWPSVGALCGTAIGLAWNFIGYKTFVFKKKS